MNIRSVAHIAVGVVGAIVAKKFFGAGLLAMVLTGLFVAWLHEAFDAPVARMMIAAGM